MIRRLSGDNMSAQGKYWETLAHKQQAREGLKQMERGYTPDLGPVAGSLPRAETVTRSRAQAEDLWKQMTEKKGKEGKAA